MAAKLLIDDRRDVTSTLIQPITGSGSPPKPMNRESQVRFVAVLLFLLTVAAVLFAGFNFSAELKSAVPDDGVWWIEHNGRLTADRVDPNGPGAKSGIKPGDQLVSINGEEVRNISGLERQLYRNGVWSKAAYSLVRQTVPLDSSVILVPAERSLNNWLRLIALIYLGIGLYVLLRRWTAPGSTHFYIFCLVSFIAYSFKYTGKLNDFDWTIYWGNIAAGVLQPALFLHFVLTFPEKREFVRKHPWLLALVYVPGAILLADSCQRDAVAAGQRASALEPRPHGNVLRVAVLFSCRHRALVQLPARQHNDFAAAIEVGDARHDSRHHSLHFVLRCPLPDGHAARSDDEDFRLVAGPAAAHVWLCHLPLPPDGRGPHLQARRGVHAGSGDCGGNVLRDWWRG